jgi:hypothetical protein
MKMQTKWLYVYYKVGESELSSFCNHATTLFKRLEQACTSAPLVFKPQLLRRPETKHGLITLMEVYGPLTEPQLITLVECLNDLRADMGCYAHLSLSSEYFSELTCA